VRPYAIALIIALGVLLPVASSADTGFEKVEPGYFGVLAFPRGVRSIGMGMTGAADDFDPANVYYNPAVLAFGPGAALTGGTNNWLSGFDISDIGVSASYQPWSGGDSSHWHLGAGIRYARLDFESSGNTAPPISGYPALDLSFSDWYLASTLAAGYHVGNLGVATGFAVKYLEARTTGDNEISTWTFDTGLLVKYMIRRPEGTNIIPSLGVSALSLGGNKNVGSAVFDPVEQIRFGAGLRMESMAVQEEGNPLSSTSPVLAVTIDGELVDYLDTDRELGSGVGVEFSLFSILDIRYGYADKQLAFEYGQTFGGGIGYGWKRMWFRLDFAMAFETNQAKNISAVGFNVDWDI
jgi:hypothetical protein